MLKKIILLLFILLSYTTFSQQNDFNLISWNIQDFGKTKSSVELDQIAEIIREADIVAIQEVVAGYGGAQAVAKLADILNRKGARWDYVISDPTHSPKYVTERYAFVWKTKHIKIKNRGRLITELDSVVDREPFLLEFYIGKRKLSILNFHSRPYNKNPQSEVKEISKFIVSFLDTSLILAGDFNMSEKDKAFSDLLEEGFSPAIFNQKTTLKKTCKGFSYLNHAIDNIYFSKDIEKVEGGIVDFVRLCDRLENARKLSDHLPVFFSFVSMNSEDK